MNHRKDNDNTLNIVKRQSDQNCQCKDGIPGPRGPPGHKGEMGKEGRKGDTGPRGKQGLQGSPGHMGLSGHEGDTGPPGPRGDPGDRGQRGAIGDPGYPGPPGHRGEIGQKGDKGDSGQRGDSGDSRGPRGLIGDTGLRGPVGEPGIKGTKGDQGLKGMKGDKEETNEGNVYVRWGHDQCPSTAQLVYSGRGGGTHFNHAGGGSNPQCLPLDPNFLTPISGSQTRSFMYGAEYRTHTDSKSYLHGRNNAQVPCAVCHVSNHTAVYMVPAKYTCPTGWTTEYYGYLMTEYYNDYRSQFVCVDIAFKAVPGTAKPSYSSGWHLHFVEGRCGSLPCPPYDSTNELSCAVCTK